MLPERVQCTECNAFSLVHAIHYVYRQDAVDHVHVQQTLSQIVMVIECPNCGARTQTEHIA